MLKVEVNADNHIHAEIGGSAKRIANDLLNTYNTVMGMIFDNGGLSFEAKEILLSEMLDALRKINGELLEVQHDS